MIKATVDFAQESASGQKRDIAEAHMAPIGQLLAAYARAQDDVEQWTGSRTNPAAEHNLLHAIINQIPDLVYAKDRQGRFLAANEAVARRNGLQHGNELLGKTDFDLHSAAVAQVFFGIEQAIMETGEPMIGMEEELSDETGTSRWIQTSKVPMRNGLGEIIGLIGVARDITERKRVEQKAEAERSLFRAMIDQVPDYLFVKDTESRFVIANRAVAADLGRQPSDLIGMTDLDFHQKKYARKFFTDEQRVIRSGEPLIDIEDMVVGSSGEDKWFSTSKVPLRNDQNQIIGIVGVCRDITDRKHAEDQMHFMALHDGLTELPNRTLLVDRLEQSILQAERASGRLTLLFIDLDNFKTVNDSLGHNAGDNLLKTIAGRMGKCVRASDTVARIGGDEFVILLVNQTGSASEIKNIVEKIRATISKPIVLDDQPFQVTSSIGVATYPADGTDAKTLMLNADTAMYEAKEAGRDKIISYQCGMDVVARERRALQESLRSAIVKNELTLVYQPQIDLKSKRIFAVEALARWHHPVLGEIPPGKFIPLAEESGLIIPLGEWALREACTQNKAWQDAGIAPITVCVNVSARQISEPDWAKRVVSIVRETGLKPQYLELEITESLLMHDVKQAIATMQELQAFGINFAIDDFGTGYSSLSALKNLPVVRLKIDRSFIRDLPNDASERNIAIAVISLGQKLNMRVIAEGVETEEQLTFLRDNHCDEMQGYHFSKPVPADAVAAMLVQS